MQVFVVLSLLAVASAVTTHSLAEITGDFSLTVYASFVDDRTPPVINSLTYPTSYDSSNTVASAFAFGGSATFSGNNSISGGQVTFTSGADTVVLGLSGSTITGQTQALAGGGYPVFRLNAPYTITSITLVSRYSFSYNVDLSSLTLPTVSATAYVNPTIHAFSLVDPQTGGCTPSGCTGNVNGTASLTSRQFMSLYPYFRPTYPAAGARFFFISDTNAGLADFNVDQQVPIRAVIGGMVNGVRVDKFTLSANTLVPQDTPLSISAQTSENNRRTYYSDAKQATVTFTSGSTDTTAPTCTAVSLEQTMVTTYYTTTSVGINITCSDSGAGLWTQGYFAQGTFASGGSVAVGARVSGGVGSITVMPQISVSFQIVGIWAVDNAGNTALYGICGGVTGYDDICGSGTSTASTITFPAFSLVVLAILALLYI